MDEMASRWVDRAVSSVFIYTRESHPGEHYPALKSMEQKRLHAEAFIKTVDLKRPLLLDTLDGQSHRSWGMMPNMTWIVAQGGIIVYKGSWTDPRDIEQSLEAWLRGWESRKESAKVPFYSERLAWRKRDDPAFLVGLQRAGESAVDEFYSTIPNQRPDRR